MKTLLPFIVLFAWFFYGLAYSTLRRAAIKLSILHYNDTNKSRPLLIWLFFTKKALYKENIYCHYGHGDEPCTASQHKYDETWWMDYQPDNQIALASVFITLIRLLGMPLLLISYGIDRITEKFEKHGTPQNLPNPKKKFPRWSGSGFMK